MDRDWHCRFLLLLLSGLLVSAAPRLDADGWERRGNEAFADARFDDAAKCYAAAEEASGEPGRVAFNHGVALFNLGKYREAERLFRASLESTSPPERHGRALFNLGASLLQGSDGRDARRLAEAADCFARCLRMPGFDAALSADAQHNLELAKLLWRRIGTGDAPPPESDPASNADETNPGAKPPENDGSGDQTSNRNAAGGPGNERTGTAPTQADGPRPVPINDAPPPGAGRHTQIPEEDQLRPLPPHEARELLRLAGERIQRERQALQRTTTGGEKRSYPDW